jgi:glyoxylase-like metal-dependent hydrolase (beta-lactamase superfamily II)
VENQLRKLSDRIYYLPFTVETDRPNLGYIHGDQYSLMVDAGNSAKHAKLFLSQLEERGLPNPDYIAITHWHWDHTFGMHAIPAKSIAGKLTNEQLMKVAAWRWDDIAMKERLTTGEEIEFCDKYIRIEYPDPEDIIVKPADIVFEQRLLINLGGISCELFPIINPHSEDSVAVYIPEERLLFLGDASGGDFYHNQGRYDKTRLINFIEFINRMDFDTCVEGHDDAISKEQLLQYMQEELEKL